jgi:hypothetical protein
MHLDHIPPILPREKVDSFIKLQRNGHITTIAPGMGLAVSKY